VRVRVLVLLAGLFLAASLAGAQPSSGSVEDALARLQDRSAKVRAQAALVLGSMDPDDRIRAALRESLSDPSPIVRAAAAKALGRRPSPDLLDALEELARDPDPMVTKWASWALRRTIATVSRLRITDTVLRISGTRESSTVGRTFESELLRGLLSSEGPFELDPRESTLDFSEDSPRDPDPGPSTADVNRWMRDGRFEMAAVEDGDEGKRAREDRPCPLRISGTVEMREGDREVVVQASIRLVMADGFEVLEGRANVRAAPPAGDPRDRDEYSIEVTPAQLRIQAAGEAGRKVAEDLRRRLRQVLQDGRQEEGGS